MTFAEQLRQEGMQQGRQQARLEIARQLAGRGYQSSGSENINRAIRGRTGGPLTLKI